MLILHLLWSLEVETMFPVLHALGQYQRYYGVALKIHVKNHGRDGPGDVHGVSTVEGGSVCEELTSRMLSKLEWG